MGKKIKENKLLIAIFLCAAILRILMIFVGYHGDLNNNISWGSLAVERGLVNYYESGNWPFSAPNQPPLTILLFFFTKIIWNFLNTSIWSLNNNIGLFPSGVVWFWERWGMIILIKLPAIIADLGIGYLIYKLVSKASSSKGVNTKTALIIASVWLFNPITWYNSAIWGQTDPIVNLLGLVSIFALLEKRLIKFAVFFTLSILFKGSLAIFIPLLGVVAVLHKYSFARWIWASIYSLIIVVVVSVWFHPQPDLFLWLTGLYTSRILPGEIGYLSANAFNFWWLVDPGKVLDSNNYFGISYRTWGFAMFAGTYLLIIIKIIKNTHTKNILMAMAVVALSAFLFMTRIHERYMYPVFPLATILLFYYPKLAIMFLILSFTFLLNMFNLFWIPELPTIRTILETTDLELLLSWLNLFIFSLLFYIFLKIPSSGNLRKKN